MNPTEPPKPAPAKPSDFELWMYGKTITGLECTRIWDDTTDNNLVTFSAQDSNETRQRDVSKCDGIVNFRPDYVALCRLTDTSAERCKAWLDFTRTNAEKLATYEKLKKELGL